MNSFRSPQGQLHYRVFGQGNPVFLLHGFLEDGDMWANIVPHLNTASHAIYVFDLPCHGQSRFEGEHCSMEQMAVLLHAFCQEKKLERPLVFGHSMGGYVGLELLRLMPLSLVLVHSNFWEDPEAKKRDRDRVVEVVMKKKEHFIQEAIPNLFAKENRVQCVEDIQQLIHKASKIPAYEIAAATRGMRDRKDHSTLFAKNNVQMIHGEKDPIIPTDLLQDKLTSFKSNTPVKVIQNCGHMSIWEKPEELIKLMNRIIFR